jgi:hypothetical protein
MYSFHQKYTLNLVHILMYLFIPSINSTYRVAFVAIESSMPIWNGLVVGRSIWDSRGRDGNVRLVLRFHICTFFVHGCFQYFQAKVVS